MKQHLRRVARGLRPAHPVFLRFAFTLVIASLPLANANTITVNSILDTSGNPGICTLRDAITAANTNAAAGGCAAGSPYPTMDAINIPLSRQYCLLNPCAFILSSPLPAVSEDVAIAGTGTWIPFINGANLYRVFDLQGVTVSLSRLNIINGYAPVPPGQPPGSGAAIRSAGATLTMANMYFSGHRSNAGGALIVSGGTVVIDNSIFVGNTAGRFGTGILLQRPYGGAIAVNAGLLIMTNSTLSGNGAEDGGAINIGGASEMRLTNVTVSANTATDDGGGIGLGGTSVSLNNVSITNNTADSDNDGVGDGGGVDGSGPTTVLMSNSVIAGNFDTPGNAGSGTIRADCSWISTGGITSFGYNLLGRNDGCAGLIDGVGGDKVGTGASPVNPLFGPLTSNGGPTQTHALLAGSPAIDAGNPLTPGGGGFAPCAATDQRGVARPVGAQCDMGAYEAPLDDADRDGIVDSSDNCVNEANGPAIADAGGNRQLDSDGDGYGNICDADLNNSGLVTAVDFQMLRSVVNQPSTASSLAAAADMNGSGTVTAVDFTLLRARINTAPGPSGLVP